MRIHLKKTMNTEYLTQEAIKLLCRLVEIPRMSREEKDAADMLEAYMKNDCGMNVKREGNNLWCMEIGRAHV